MARIFEVFYRFLALGCISFGGPAAHIGYFQTAFVQKLKWIDQESYAKLVALSQFLPGPGSSQVGFAIGLRRAGLLGGIAAFLGFTLPSFILLFLLASVGFSASDSNIYAGVLQGLKLLAVVVVADACLTMLKSFCKDRFTISLTVFTIISLLALPSMWMQIAALSLAAILGAIKGDMKSAAQTNLNVPHPPKGIRVLPLFMFLLILICLSFFAANNEWIKVFYDFYYSGSLVFGGGHVVLPLLQQSVGDLLDVDQFLTGYAAAQAVPGPMFSLAAYLGAELTPQHQLLGAILATFGIFLPGFLLVLALQGAWESLTNHPKVSGAVSAINAAVVGLLVAALYQPIYLNAVIHPIDMAAVVCGFFLLRILSIPIVLLVVIMVGFGIVLNF